VNRQANRRYLYFAAKADVEGYNDVSAVFRSNRRGRDGPCSRPPSSISRRVGDPGHGACRLGKTKANLKVGRSAGRDPRVLRTCIRAWPRPPRGEGFAEIAELVRDPGQGRAFATRIASRKRSTRCNGAVSGEGNLGAPTRHPLNWAAIRRFMTRQRASSRNSSACSTSATDAGAASACARPFPTPVRCH